MKAKINDFKWNEITSLFEHAKSIGIQPTLIITFSKHGRFNFVWIEARLRDAKLTSRIYDQAWLVPRIKHYIKFNAKCPYGEIRVKEINND